MTLCDGCGHEYPFIDLELVGLFEHYCPNCIREIDADERAARESDRRSYDAGRPTRAR